MNNSPPIKPLQPVLALAFGILATSTASIFIRYAQAEAPSLVIAACRLSLATLALSPLALTRGRPELKTFGRGEIAPALLSGFFLALHFATWITSLEYTSVASSVVFVTTTPLWVALCSPFVLKEPITRPVRIGMALALAGGIVIGLSESCSWNGSALACPPLAEFIQGKAFLGDLLALAGALAAAAYLLIGRRMRVRMSLVPYIFVVYGAAAVILVIFMFAAGFSPLGYSPAIYLWFLLLALVPQLLGHSIYNWALRYVSAAYVSISLLGEPIGSTLLALILLNEVPSGLKIFGAILILAGIVVAAKREG